MPLLVFSYYHQISQSRSLISIAPARESRIHNTLSRGIGCTFSIMACELPWHQGWELKHRPEYKFSIYNHAPSPYPGAHLSYRHMPSQTQAITQVLFNAGIYKEL